MNGVVHLIMCRDQRNTVFRVPTIRENQGKSGKFCFSGKSGNLSCFLRIRENQGIIFVTDEWSGKVREFSSDSGQLTV